MTLADALARELPAGPRVLVIDLERLIGILRRTKAWEHRDAKYRNYYRDDQWARYPSTLCASWQWLGDRTIHFAAAWEGDGDHTHNRDDGPNCVACREHIAAVTWGLYDAADIVVTFNGRKADNRWCANDWAEAGLPAPKPWKDADLYTAARSRFAFEYRSLAHLCKRLEIKGKTDKYDAERAEDAYMGDVKAQTYLRRYNGGDIVATREALKRLQGNVRFPGVNWALFFDDDAFRCSHCGHDRLDADGQAATGVTRYAQYRCRKCGGLTRNASRKHSVKVRTSA